MGVQPVYRDVEGAGAAMRGVAAVGQGLSSLGASLAQAKDIERRQNEAVLQQQLDDAVRQYGIDAKDAEARRRDDPNAITGKANDFVSGQLRQVTKNLGSMDVSPEFRASFNAHLEAVGEGVATGAALSEQTWVFKANSDYMRESARRNAEMGISVDPEKYAAGVVDTPHDVALVQAKELNTQASYARSSLAMSSAASKAEVGTVLDAALASEELTLQQKAQLQSEARSRVSAIQTGLNSQVADATKLGNAYAANVVSGLRTQEDREALTAAYARMAGESLEERRRTIASFVDRHLVSQEEADELVQASSEELLELRTTYLNQLPVTGKAMSDVAFSSLMSQISTGSISFANLEGRRTAMSSDQFEAASMALQRVEQADQEALSSLSFKTGSAQKKLSDLLTEEVMAGREILTTDEVQEAVLQIGRITSPATADAYTRMLVSAMSAAQQNVGGEYQAGQGGSNLLWRHLPFTSVRSKDEIAARDSVFEYLNSEPVKNHLWAHSLLEMVPDAQKKLDAIWEGEGTVKEKTTATEIYLGGLKEQVGRSIAADAVARSAAMPATNSYETPVDLTIGAP